MSQMIIPVGNIGCGKSLMASKYAKNGFSVVNMDIIQSMFAGGEYGAYDHDKKNAYLATETMAIESSLKDGQSVFIDRTNVDKKRRSRFIEIGKKYGAEIVALEWGPGDPDSLERRIKNSRGIPANKWKEVHRYMSDTYEQPLLSEGFDDIIKAPTKFKFHAFDFDGTIVESKFPDIGLILDGTVAKMNEIWKDTANIIIVWTCRDGDYENQMKAFLLKNNIPFDFINENPIFSTNSPKIFAHKYYDDRNEDFSRG